MKMILDVAPELGVTDLSQSDKFSVDVADRFCLINEPCLDIYKDAGQF